MSRDSVAVLRGLKADLRAGMPKGAPVREYGRPEEYAALDEAIAALTREAAPQASGGDDVGRWFVCVSCLAAVNLPADVPRPARCQCSPSSFMLWPIKLPKGFAIRRLATTDSAIQSQQGATGGAVDCLALRPWSDFWASRGRTDVSHDFATFRLAEEWATACITAAHPQAAGSAPVGVDAWSPLLRYGRHDADCAYCHDSAYKPRPVCTCGFDAALEKERAE